MQKLTRTTSIASLHSQASSPESVNYLANPDYVAAATQMLSTNTGERVAFLVAFEAFGTRYHQDHLLLRDSATEVLAVKTLTL